MREKCFERVTQLNPTLPTGWNNAGVVAEHVGDITAADSFYKKALELAPGYLDANFNRGNLFPGQGNAGFRPLLLSEGRLDRSGN